MLENKKNVNINISPAKALLLIAIILLIGVSIKLNFQNKDSVEIETIAIDNLGYIGNEQFMLEAKKIDTDLYEIELPQNINTKDVNKITNVTLENASNNTQEKVNVEVLDNKIQLTNKQLKNHIINLDVEYNAILKQKQEDGTVETINLVEKTEEEVKKLEITDKTDILYEKTIEHEETDENSLVKIKGKMPENIELQVERISREKIKEIFGDNPIDVAYDIKILENGTTEINPKNFGETYEVSVSDANILEHSKVYHVKDDNTYDPVRVIENEDGNISFEAQSFSIYAIGNYEENTNNTMQTFAAGRSLAYQTRFDWRTSDGRTGSCAATSDQWPTIRVPDGGTVTITNDTYGSNALCVTKRGNNCVQNHSSSHRLSAGSYTVNGANGYNSHTQGAYTIFLTVVEVKAPSISVSPASCAWRNSGIDVRISVSKGDYSLSSPSYQYYLSTSSSSLTGGSWQDYPNGGTINITPQITGTYYLFVKRVRDTEGNYSKSSSASKTTTISSIPVHMYGAYKFDYINPSAGTMTIKLGSASGSDYINGTWARENVYIAVNNGSDSQSGHASTTYTVTKDGTTYLSNQIAPQILTEDGNYTIVVTTKDNAGNSATRTYELKIDKTAPVPGTMTMRYMNSSGEDYPNATWTNKDIYIALNNGSDATSGHKSTTYTITKDGVIYADTQTGAQTLTAEGRYTIVVTTEDVAGNISTNTYNVYIDKTMPGAGTLKMKIDNPSGANYTGTTVRTIFTGDWTAHSIYIELNNGTDGLSGIKSTTYSINGGEEETLAKTLVEEGAYTIEVVTSDLAGNVCTRTYIINIDKTPPTVGTLIMKYGNSTGKDFTSGNWANQDIYIAVVNGSDTLSGHKSTTYRVTKDGEEYANNQTIEQTLTEEGIYTIVVTTTDNVGHTATSDEYVIKIDKTPPTGGSLILKYNNASGPNYPQGEWTFESVYVELISGYDEIGGSGHKSTTYTVLKNEEEYLVDQTSPMVISQGGAYTLIVKTIDNAGNITESAEYIVKIDSEERNAFVNINNGLINPIYKPEWEIAKDANGVNKVHIDTTNKTLSIDLKGSSYEYQKINSDVTVDYASDVTSTLEEKDITIFINGVEVTSTVNPKINVSEGTISINGTSGKKDITHTIVLSNLEEASRRAGIPYKELSGNISLKIAGRGQNSSTYRENVLTDIYGNQNMMETDQNGTNADGTWIKIVFEDDVEVNSNTDGVMFADFVKPEFTYLSSETTVDYDNKILTVKFSTVDKYFDVVNSNLVLSDLTLVVDGETVNINASGNALTSETVLDAGEITRIGTKYTLVVKNLQKYQGAANDGLTYSGIVSIGIPANKIQDLSGNKNDATTITIGVDDTDGNPNSGVDSDGEIVDVVDPIWKAENLSIDQANQKVTVDLIAKDKYFESCNLTTNDIAINVDGIDMKTANKTLSAKKELFEDRDGDGTNETKYGEKYTLTITDWNEDEQEEVYIDWNGIRRIVIGENTITDQYGNTNEEQQIILEDQNNAYIPSFTNRDETELNYTTDSKVDIIYTLYERMEQTPYADGDYRTISTKAKLPAGTRLTLKDYVQGKIYYYNITEETKYQVENGKYIYKLSNFIEMGSTDKHYTDSNTYYDSNAKYVLEKYNLSIDFLDANINADKLEQETYLELRSLAGVIKYNNGDTTAKYNLRYEKNAIMSETISNEGQTYIIGKNTEISFKLDASLIEQKTTDGKKIMDTKYYDKIEGIAIEILDENGNRLKGVQDFKLIDVGDANEIYVADKNGVIRIPIMQELSSISKNYKMTLSNNDVKTGEYSVNVYFFASDDGKHIGDEAKVQKEFYATVKNTDLGLLGVEATDDSRIINKKTGLNLEGNNGIDMTVKVGDLTSQTNIRVELYKREQTYADSYNEITYTGTSYTLVDLKDYLDGTWQTPEECGLVSATDSKEYMLLPRQSYESLVEYITIDLERAIKTNIATGEYKLVIKSYDDNSLVQTVSKTFIVTK